MQSSFFPTDTPQEWGLPSNRQGTGGSSLFFPLFGASALPKSFLFFSVDDWLPQSHSGVSYSGLPVRAAATSPALLCVPSGCSLRVFPPGVPSGCPLWVPSALSAHHPVPPQPFPPAIPLPPALPCCSHLLLPRPTLQFCAFTSPFQLLLWEETSAPSHPSPQGSSPPPAPPGSPPSLPTFSLSPPSLLTFSVSPRVPQALTTPAQPGSVSS